MTSWTSARCVSCGLTGLVLSTALAVSPGHAQLLDSASSAVRGESSSSSSSSDDSSGSSSDGGDDGDDDYDDQSDEGGLLDSASRAVRSERGGDSPSAPYGRLGGGGGEVLVLGAHPYSDGASGYARPAKPEDGIGRVGVRAEVEGGYVLGGAGRAGASMRVHLPFALDLSTRYSLFIEPVGDGADFAALGRLALDWRFLDTPHVQLRLGAAVRHFQDAAGGVFGFDGAFGFDVFPGPPFVISVDASAGIVGAALIVQVRASIGVLIDTCELYAGYDYEALFAGGNQVDLGGPMLGLRIWGG